MYLTIRNYAGSNEIGDALVEHQDEIKELVSGIDGFRAYYVVRTADGAAATVTVYDDQGGAEESNRMAAAWVAEHLAELEVKAQVTAGEVVVSR